MFRSWLGWLNFFVLQWFFVRLQEVGRTEWGKWVHERWELLLWPVPLSGWWTRYLYVYRGAVARRHKQEPTGYIPRYAFLKKRLLKCLENGPKSAYSLEVRMRDEGFRTARVIRLALDELVASGEVQIKVRENGKAWLYERARLTLDS